MENIEQENDESNKASEEIKEMSETDEQQNDFLVESRTISQEVKDEPSEVTDLDEGAQEQKDEESEEIKKMLEMEEQYNDSLVEGGTISEEVKDEASVVTDLGEGAEEEKDEESEEIKEMEEMEEQHIDSLVKSGTISEEVNEEASLVTDLGEEAEEEKDEQSLYSSSTPRKMSQQFHQSVTQPVSQPKSHSSIGQYSLRSSTVSSVKHEHEGKHGPVLVSRRTGKIMCDNFNQTSSVWEKKPLAEILHPATKILPVSDNTGKDDVGAEDNVITSAGNVEDKQALEEENGQALEEDDELPENEESNLSHQPPEIKQSQESITLSIPTQGETYYGPDSLYPEELRIPFNPDPSPEDKKSKQPQQTDPARDDQIWISKRTGKEVRSNFNQTSLIWEKKPLAEILQRTRAGDKGPDPDQTQPPED